VAPRTSTTLTQVELEFMHVIWQSGEVSADHLTEALRSQGRSLTGGSVRKILLILLKKGYLTRRKVSHAFLYKPAVGKGKATTHMALDVLKRAFGGNAALMVAALLDSRAVRRKDIEIIKQLIAEREREERR